MMASEIPSSQLNSLLNEYVGLSHNFKKQQVTKKVLNKALGASFTAAQSNDENAPPASAAAGNSLLSSVKELASQMNELQNGKYIGTPSHSSLRRQSLTELAISTALSPALDDALSTSNVGDSNDNVSNGDNSEIRQLENILQRITTEKIVSDQAISQKQMKIDEIKVHNSSLATSAEENEGGDAVAAVASTGADPLQIGIYNQSKASLESSKEDAAHVFEGLRLLQGVQNFNIEETGSGMLISVEFDKCSAVFALDVNFRLGNIKITDSQVGPLQVQGLLQECVLLPTPQDLRHAICHIRAAQNSAGALQKHISQLRKMCIVKLGANGSFQVTLASGLTLHILVHECYPDVPGAVRVDSVVGVGGWTAEECAAVRRSANAKCFNSVIDTVEFVMHANAGII